DASWLLPPTAFRHKRQAPEYTSEESSWTQAARHDSSSSLAAPVPARASRPGNKEPCAAGWCAHGVSEGAAIRAARSAALGENNVEAGWTGDRAWSTQASASRRTRSSGTFCPVDA